MGCNSTHTVWANTLATNNPFRTTSSVKRLYQYGKILISPDCERLIHNGHRA